GIPCPPSVIPANAGIQAKKARGTQADRPLVQARHRFMTCSRTGMLLAIVSGLCGIGSLTAVVPVMQASAQPSVMPPDTEIQENADTPATQDTPSPPADSPANADIQENADTPATQDAPSPPTDLPANADSQRAEKRTKGMLSDRIAAVINTDVIMLSELDEVMSDELIRLRARYDGEEFEAKLLQKQHQVLNRIIERKIQLQEAREKEITVTEEEVDTAWAQVQRNPEAYPPEFIRSRDVFREEMVLRRVAEFEVQRRILVPFEEVRDYYQEREQDFATPPEYHLHQIVLQPKPDESMEELRERAETLERQLQEGASFEKLASIYSDGPTKDQGGDLEFVQKEDLRAPLRSALDALEPGERSPVIETDIGMHILLLGEIRKGTPQPFDEVKDEVEKRLYQKKRLDAHRTWLSALKDKSYINILL
ncbi:MAG: peptidyl-prolyl cis-trans isomerase, partial [Nitrospira sp.]|nr:peptidyl-prolyl cis-trans isomerase [Nitrospira sp.]